MIFERPIPGQSLTTEPGNMPYENPPELVDPEQAALVHLERINNAEAVESILFFLENGISVVAVTEGLLRTAVLAGVHSVDVSLIIGPIIHEFIKSAADAAGIEYDEGLEDREGKAAVRYNRDVLRARKMLSEMDISPEETVEKIEEPEDVPEEPMMEEPVTEEKPKEGLMARMEE